MSEILKQHGKKVAGTAATGGIGGVMVWALMTFTPLSQHEKTRLEIQALREAVAPIRYDYEKKDLPCSCGRTNSNP